MLRNVFYFGNKPNAHPKEQHANNLAHARELSTTEHFWIINEYSDYRNFDWGFDFDFLPDEDTWTSKFNNVWPSEFDKDSGTWLCTTLEEDTCIYRTDVDPIKLKNQSWKFFAPVDMTSIDLSWRPDPTDPPYIYTWGNKYVPAEVEPTVEYHAENSIDRKYMGDVRVFPQWDRWTEYVKVDRIKFDFSWRPDPTSPPYIYVWGNKYVPAEHAATIEYHMPDATEKKYMGVVDVEPEWDRWTEHTKIDKTSFDMSWRPDINEPPYIYVWGNKYNSAEQKPTIEYIVPGATEKKYMGIVDVEPEWDRWNELIAVDKNSFDFSWRPNINEPPLIYVFGNKWNDSKTEPTIEYTVPGATVKKYMDYPVAVPKSNMSLWTVNNKEDLETFDFSWRPNPHSQPQIYQWVNNGPRYSQLNATEVVLMEYEDNNHKGLVNRYTITTTLEELINQHADEVFWALNPDLNYDNFDFSWRPNYENFRHINVFGNEFSKNTQTYYINGPMYTLGYRELNYVADLTVEIDTNLSMFYIDRGNSNRYDELKLRYPQLQKTRYLNSWVETIQRCCNKSNTKLFWVVNSELDYSEFMFDFYPSPWQMDMVHVFGTQWSHWGNTYLVNKETFEESTKYVKVIEHLNILNFVKSKRAKAVDILYDIVYIDHGNLTEIESQDKLIVKYDTSYLKTFKTLLTLLPDKKEHYVWVVSTICDYNNFDFTYICDPYAKEQLHVFPSNMQKFGDTFLVNVNKLRSLIDTMTTLEEYEKVNYNQHQRVKRLPAPVIKVTTDTHSDSINTEYQFPYAIFQTEDIPVVDIEPMNLWEPESKAITVLSHGASSIVVPREAKNYVKKELYDYPYIKKSSKLVYSNPLDIVFISNGETNADDNYEHLLFLTGDLSNRVTRVNGVNGRVASQYAAANASKTPWYFLVNAKLKVNPKFDFDWQPDRLQIPKHYIFTATNPINHLEYGHQAIVANNKTITLNTVAKGLDFTMDGEHEVINVNSGIGMYNTSIWDTWRTSFRETLKLKFHAELTNSLESKYRLSAWLNLNDGEFGEYSTAAAQDACVYYDSVNGDLDKLRLSYDWEWLKTYFDSRK